MSIKNNLEENHTYLVRYVSSHHSSLSSITILMVTEKAYNIRWNNSMSSTTTWELITNVNSEYELIEDISDQLKDKKEYPFIFDVGFYNEKEIMERINKLSKYIDFTKKPCPYCSGNGYVPDSTSTAGTKICPKCNGGKILIM